MLLPRKLLPEINSDREAIFASFKIRGHRRFIQNGLWSLSANLCSHASFYPQNKKGGSCRIRPTVQDSPCVEVCSSESEVVPRIVTFSHLFRTFMLRGTHERVQKAFITLISSDVNRRFCERAGS